MIKLDTSYSLGSIIESNFLGISNDAEPTNVIVTLSKNMVTCFHVCTCILFISYFISSWLYLSRFFNYGLDAQSEPGALLEQFR